MIIVELMGGLGNQMFEYAAARCLAERWGHPLKMDTATLLDRSNPTEGFVFRDYDLGIWNIQESFATPEEVFALTNRSRSDAPLSFAQRLSRKANHLLKSSAIENRVYKEPHFHYDRDFYTKTAPLYLQGYWQSEDYFKPIAHIIRQEFTFKNPLSSHCEGLAAQIENTESICLNVRRGDFVSSPKTNQLLGFVGINYLEKGVDLIADKLDNPHVYIFSDEPEWCKENLKLPYPTTLVSHEYAGEKFRDYLDLMIRCKYFVIPNSSFAWWAAWLAPHKQKIVVAPKRWFADKTMSSFSLIPPSWVQV
jgi:hypothetical protein